MLSLDRERQLRPMFSIHRVSQTSGHGFELAGERQLNRRLRNIALYLGDEHQLITFQIPVTDEFRVGRDLLCLSVAEYVGGARLESQQVVGFERREVVLQGFQTSETAFAFDLSDTATSEINHEVMTLRVDSQITVDRYVALH